jgi:hypothetical protein
MAAANPDVQAASSRLASASPASKVLLAGSVFFVVVSFLAWQKACFENICGSATAWHGVGIVATLLAIAILVLQVLDLLDVRLQLDRSAQTAVVVGLAGGTLVFTVIKILVDNEFRAYGSWLGLIAAAVIAVGGVMALGEANAAAARERRRRERASAQA